MRSLSSFWEDDAYPERLKKYRFSSCIFVLPRNTFARRSIFVSSRGNTSYFGARKTNDRTNGQWTCSCGNDDCFGACRGVDALAHRKTLQEKGRTIAVLGCGIDTIYPPEHRELAEEILASGAILSEFAPGVPPHHYHFPRRNRIVSGLSLGTLVIEGTEKADHSLPHNLRSIKTEKCLPFRKPASATAFGPNRLIQKGEAKLVLTPRIF